MHESELLSPYATKAVEYGLAILYLALFVPFWRYLNGPARVRVPSTAWRFADWFYVPDGVHLHAGHTWARPQADGVAVGIDDFGHDLVGPLDGVELPAVGLRVKQGQPAFSIRAGGTSFPVLAPVSGTRRRGERRRRPAPRRAPQRPVRRRLALPRRADRARAGASRSSSPDSAPGSSSPRPPRPSSRPFTRELPSSRRTAARPSTASRATSTRSSGKTSSGRASRSDRGKEHAMTPLIDFLQASGIFLAGLLVRLLFFLAVLAAALAPILVVYGIVRGILALRRRQQGLEDVEGLALATRRLLHEGPRVAQGPPRRRADDRPRRPRAAPLSADGARRAAPPRHLPPGGRAGGPSPLERPRGLPAGAGLRARRLGQQPPRPGSPAS